MYYQLDNHKQWVHPSVSKHKPDLVSFVRISRFVCVCERSHCCRLIPFPKQRAGLHISIHASSQHQPSQHSGIGRR